MDQCNKQTQNPQDKPNRYYGQIKLVLQSTDCAFKTGILTTVQAVIVNWFDLPVFYNNYLHILNYAEKEKNACVISLISEKSLNKKLICALGQQNV